MKSGEHPGGAPRAGQCASLRTLGGNLIAHDGH